ncbi:MAG: hypothetical protein MMC23_005112 [Stictis urceolatum]|nr:hypothetical protein [Stictis urceolata]
MAESSLTDKLAALLSPSPTIIITSILIALLVPLILHLALFRTSSSTTLPSFLLVGPSNSGKTSLLTLLERGTPAQTHTSQTPLSVEVSLPISTKAASTRYRSSHDPSLSAHKKFLLIDTPGHGKLRHHALSSLTQPKNLKGLIFVVDATNLTAGSPGLREAAEYLHDLLLLVQKRAAAAGSKGLKGLPVLVAANKSDLFTALPVGMVRKALELEITGVRASRSKGLLDSGIGMDDVGDPEKEWLGEGGEGAFEFSQLEEFEVEVSVEGSVAVGAEGSDVQRWWQWIGDCL